MTPADATTHTHAFAGLLGGDGDDGHHGEEHASGGGHSHHDHPTPLQRLNRLLWEDRSDLTVLVSYTVLTGLLALATPLAVQALVNSIAAGFSLQPLVVLTLLVLLGLLLAGGLFLLQLSLVETLQQRLFARLGLRMAQRLVRAKASALEGRYGPELVNRFFDVLTIQKTLSKLLLDGVAAGLQAMVGLVLMAFYSPLLLGFDVLVLASLAFVVFALGVNGLRTSLAESNEKYRVAGWLEELARCQTSFKMNGAPVFLLKRADSYIVRYIAERRRHFRVTFRQEFGNQVLTAFATAGVLGIGGYLVINSQITLGQLVAAQLIVGQVLKGTSKLIRQAEVVFDLLTGLDKTGYITDLDTERAGGRPLPALPSGGTEVVVRDVRFAYPDTAGEVLMGLNLTLTPGEHVSLVGASGAGKSTLAALLCGLEEPSHGSVEINDLDIRAVDLADLRRYVTLVGYNNEVFEGTIEENITVGRPFVTHRDVRWAVEMAGLADDVALMPKGLLTPLVPGGKNLSRGQLQRLLIARALAGRPQLLILDEAFTGIDERTTLKILDNVFAPEHSWTIIDISHDPGVVMRSARVHVLADGRIVESGAPAELARKESGEFAQLFPYLAQQIAAVNPAGRTSTTKKTTTRKANNEQ